MRLPTDYILFGKTDLQLDDSLALLLQSCDHTERLYAEKILKTFLTAMATKKDPL